MKCNGPCHLIETQSLPTATTFFAELANQISNRKDCSLQRYANITYKTPKGELPYEMFKVSSSYISHSDRIILIRAGIHGDEIAGPLTILRNISKIFDLANLNNVKLIIFPLDNPSGFEFRTRYNIENDRGSNNDGNNDFVRYETDDGSIIADLATKTTFKNWFWSSDENICQRLQLALPKETQALHLELKKLPLQQVYAVIDLHQDNFISCPGSYFYAFSDRCKVEDYDTIIKEIDSYLPVFRNKAIGSGQASAVTSNGRGYISRHDGTLPDLFYHLGAMHTITVETTGASDFKAAENVNLLWIKKILEFSNPLKRN